MLDHAVWLTENERTGHARFDSIAPPALLRCGGEMVATALLAIAGDTYSNLEQ